MSERPWYRDHALHWGMLVATWLRFLPMATWPNQPCVRDECTYLGLSSRIMNGEGMTQAAAGWLWAPGYPYLMALHDAFIGLPASVKVTQTLIFLVSLVVVYRGMHGRFGKAAAGWSLWLLGLSPTLVFFSTALWSEVFYTAILFFALFSLDWARKGGPERGLAPGALVGVCVLFRGVAQYMLPIFMLGMLWKRWKDPGAWKGVAAMALAAAILVSPYSLSSTQRWGGFVLSDRTMGQMMWLGNNTFDPVTFDWGNGTLTKSGFNRLLRDGRGRCDKTEGPIAWDDCERQGGVNHIKADTGEFVERIPLRLAQLMNPHSFLTRHLRWGKWKELPKWAREPLMVGTVVWSFLAIVFGTLGAFSRGRGWMVLVTGLIVAYHGAAISLLAGLSRYRVPLDAIWLLWAGAFLANPRESLALLVADKWRLAGCVVALAVFLPLMLWFLPAGFPEWRSWSSS